MSTDGIVHMDAGPNIGRCIYLIQKGYHMGENIISGHNSRSQSQSVWPQCGNDQEYSHTRKEEFAGSEIFLFILKH
jgi:hypothetical protein